LKIKTKILFLNQIDKIWPETSFKEFN